jgi:O-antigen/teichoic acid export membrane protein
MGIADAGISSVATLICGTVALRKLSGGSLSAYATFNAAFLVAGVVPTSLVFTPAQVAVLHEVPKRHVRYIWHVLLRGMVVAMGASAIAIAIALPFALHLSVVSQVIPLAITAFIATTVSPLQDFVRRLLHQSGLSWTAVATAIVQLVLVIAAVGVALATHVTFVWIPFTALAIANVGSALFAIALVRADGLLREPGALRTRTLMQSGRWLLIQGLSQFGMWFVAVLIVGTLGKQHDVGYAEGARVLAQPPVVLATGLLAVIGPRIMAATQMREWDRIRRLRLGYFGLMLGAALAYIVVVGIPWSLSPLPHFYVPAYTQRGLVAAMILGQTLVWTATIFSNQAIAIRRERAVAWAGLVAAVAQIVITVALVHWGALAIAAGLVGYAVVLAAILSPIVGHRGHEGPLPVSAPNHPPTTP